MYLFCIYFVFPLYLAQARSRQWECEWARWPGGSCGTASPSLAGGKTAWREPPPPSFLSLQTTLPSPWGHHTVSGGVFPVSEWSERQRTRVFTHILWHFAKRCSAKSRRVAPQCARTSVRPPVYESTFIRWLGWWHLFICATVWINLLLLELRCAQCNFSRVKLLIKVFKNDPH